MNEYVTVMTPEAPLPNYTIYPKPINPYYDHIYNTQFHINMRIVLKNRFNQIFLTNTLATLQPLKSMKAENVAVCHV